MPHLNLRHTVSYLSFAVILLAIVSTLGWLQQYDVLVSFFSGFPTIKFNTALCFFLLALSLIFYLSRRIRLTLLFGTLVFLLSDLTLLQDLFNLEMGIDQFLITDHLTPPHKHPGRMSPATAICFMLASAGILAQIFRELRPIGQALLNAVFLFTWASLMSYILNTPESEKPFMFASMSAPTTTCFFLVTIAGGLLHPKVGVTKYFLGNRISARTTRYLITWISILGMALIILVTISITFGLLSLRFGASVYSSLFLALGMFLIARSGHRIDELDDERQAELVTRKKAEQRFKVIFDESPLAKIVVDSDGILASINKQGEKLFGYPASEIIGTSISRLIPSESKNKHPELIRYFFQNPTTKNMGMGREVFCINNSGEKIPIEIRLAPLEIDNKSFALASITEIGERKAMESIERKNRELMIEQKELERFTYVASHDLQEPLRTVSNYIEILKEDYGESLNQDAKKHLSTIENATNRMRSLVLSLLDYSRLDRDKKQEVRDINEAIKNVTSDLSQLIKSNDVEIIVDTAMPTLRIFSVEFRLLLQNLITNSIKFQKPDTKPVIHIGCSQEGHKCTFYVKDNGIGIEEQFFDKVFQMFQRLHSKAEYRGHGIGLANCKKIVEMHGGSIWLESKVNEGSTFYFTIIQNEKV